MSFCPKCGAPLREGDIFCSKCGEKLARPAAPAPAGEKKSGGKIKSVLIWIGCFLLFFALGRLLSSGWDLVFGGRPTPAPTPIPVAVPTISFEPAKPLPTLQPTPTPTPLPTPEPTPEFWNWEEASDDEVRAIMSYFLCGKDPATGKTVVFFCDENVERGGYFYWISTEKSFNGTYSIGTLVDGGGDTIYILSEEGREAIRFQTDRDDSALFFIGSGEVFPNGVRLYRDDSRRDTIMDFFLSRKHTLSILRDATK